jgi:OOP family OmpA-OmpF porin
MKLRIALMAATVLAVPFAVHAQPVDGLYVGAGAGGNILTTETVTRGPARLGTGSNLKYDAGPIGIGSVGWGLGNGLRFELQGAFYDNKLSGVKNGGAQRFTSAGGDEQKFGVFANVLYDIPLAQMGIDSPVFPYVGLGIGYLHNDFDNVHIVGPGSYIRSTGQNDNLAAQGIVGIGFPLVAVPGLSLTAEYRFTGEIGGRAYKTQDFANSGASGGAIKQASDDFNNSFLLGVRYAFNTAPPPPPPAPVVPQAQVAPARTYLVFFDWDRADLTDRARQIIAEAAQASTHVQYTRIEVQGNADRSGTPAYNQGLSLRRAQTVAAELVRQGVPRTAIDIQAFGDTRPLVPTAAGVREPQNRRVAIILQ